MKIKIVKTKLKEVGFNNPFNPRGSIDGEEILVSPDGLETTQYNDDIEFLKSLEEKSDGSEV